MCSHLASKGFPQWHAVWEGVKIKGLIEKVYEITSVHA